MGKKAYQLNDDFGNNLLADVGVNNLMQEITHKLTTDIQNKRYIIIEERLKELTGIKLDIKAEAKRRFKRLAIEHDGNEETVYYNDGSVQGKRIVTFVRTDNSLTFEANKAQMRYSYY